MYRCAFALGPADETKVDETGGYPALKDADGLIRDMLSTCDINHDGQITYDEFVKFCNETEKELWTLFQSIDRDHNGNLDKSELSQAFERAGVAVSNARLDRFFGYIDKNHDGKIDFPEWRGPYSYRTNNYLHES